MTTPGVFLTFRRPRALVPPRDDSRPTSLPTPPRNVSWGIPTKNVFLMTEEEAQQLRGRRGNKEEKKITF